MKVKYILIYAVSIGVIGISCNGSIKHDKIDSVVFNLKDTTSDSLVNKYDADDKYFETARELNLAKDSLDILKDNIDNMAMDYHQAIATRDSVTKLYIITNEKLGVAEYKLLRIREYNRIAAQGNNIKFLRGWITRTINK